MILAKPEKKSAEKKTQKSSSFDLENQAPKTAWYYTRRMGHFRHPQKDAAIEFFFQKTY